MGFHLVRTQMLRPFFVAACAALSSASLASANPLYVDIDAASGGDGLSWATAFNDLQDALAVINTGSGAYTDIWIAEGIYVPGNSEGSSFQLRDACNLYGGFDGSETMLDQRDPVANPTILSGERGNPSTVNDNIKRVVRSMLTGDKRLDGLIIEDGNADGLGDTNGSGAGITHEVGHLTIHNCRIRNNTAVGDGAGVLGSNITIIDSVFSFCDAGEDGGAAAVGNVTIRNSQFLRCTAGRWGGALATGSADIEDCTFTGNSADLEGGAIRAVSPFRMVNCSVAGNTAPDGGGLHLGGLATPGQDEVDGVTFVDNTADRGGAVYTILGMTFLNLQCEDNSATEAGGAFYISGVTGRTILQNCTLRLNSAMGHGGGVGTRIVDPANPSSIEIIDSLIEDNTAITDGGGVAAPIVASGTMFRDNLALGVGGAIAFYGDSELLRCTFVDNEANTGGAISGAVVIDDEEQSDMTIDHCTFLGNSATSSGGAIDGGSLAGMFTIRGSLFGGNTAVNADGGAIRTNNVLEIESSTFAGNAAPGGIGGGIRLYAGFAPQFDAVNTIVWGNSDQDGSLESSQISAADYNDVTADYCCIQDFSGVIAGANNIAADPDFVSPLTNDYSLGAASSCIDAGDTFSLGYDVNDLDGDGDLIELSSTDLDGGARLIDDVNTPDTGAGPAPVLDIGAYEFGPQPCPDVQEVQAEVIADSESNPPVGMDETLESFNNADIGPSGDIMYELRVDTPLLDEEAIFLKTGAQHESIVRQGDPSPGLPGVTFGEFDAWRRSATDRLVFESRLEGGSVSIADDESLWSIDGTATPVLLAREGGQVAVLPPGVLYDNVVPDAGFLLVGVNGLAVYYTSVQGAGVTGSNSNIWWRLNGVAPEIVWRGGDPIPGTSTPTDFIRFVDINANDQVVALSNDASGESYWMGTTDNLVRLIGEGDQAPQLAAGITIDGFFASPRLNDDGKAAIRALLAGPGITPSNRACLYLGTPGDLTVVARSDDPVPGLPGLTYWIQSSYELANGDLLAIEVDLNGPGVTSSSNSAVLLWDGATLTTIAREGDQAPGAALGTLLGQPEIRAINSSGSTLIFSDLGVTDGYFLYDDVNGLRPVVFTEDNPIELTSGEMKILESAFVSSGGTGPVSSGRRVLNEAGQMAFVARFSGEERAVLRVSLPTPCDGDANGDGMVDFDDLNLILLNWATMGCPPIDGDVNGDGDVNFDDLNGVLLEWNTNCP